MKIRRIIKQEVDFPGLGARIKEARLRSDYSLTQLAKAAGISRNYWYQLEAEAVLGGVALQTLQDIEKVLGVEFGIDFEESLAS